MTVGTSEDELSISPRLRINATLKSGQIAVGDAVHDDTTVDQPMITLSDSTDSDSSKSSDSPDVTESDDVSKPSNPTVAAATAPPSDSSFAIFHATEKRPCFLTIDGRKYNMTNWAESHPGGPIIHIYHDRDASDVFRAFHGDDAFTLLKKFPSTPVEDDDEAMMASRRERDKLREGKLCDAAELLDASMDSFAIMRDFAQLRKDFDEAGFFTFNPAWVFITLIPTLLMLPAAVYLNYQGWFYTSAFLMGLMWQQLGWISHELLHHQVFPARWIGTGLAWFCACVMMGLSRLWWNARHNAHHAATNIDGSDPDIDNLPFLAWSEDDVAMATPLQRRAITYQHRYFWFILPFLNLIWCVNSILFSQNVMRTTRYKGFNKFYATESLGLAIHYACFITFLATSCSSVSSALLYILLSKLVGGSFLAYIVFFNHYSCPKLSMGTTAAENYVVMQLVSTRNMNPGYFTDWFCGGLNYQVEHHLFPTMPRGNLYKTSLRVRAFCAKHNLPYLCDSFSGGIKLVYNLLKDISDLAQKTIEEEELKKQNSEAISSSSPVVA